MSVPDFKDLKVGMKFKNPNHTWTFKIIKKDNDSVHYTYSDSDPTTEIIERKEEWSTKALIDWELFVKIEGFEI